MHTTVTWKQNSTETHLRCIMNYRELLKNNNYISSNLLIPLKQWYPIFLHQGWVLWKSVQGEWGGGWERGRAQGSSAQSLVPSRQLTGTGPKSRSPGVGDPGPKGWNFTDTILLILFHWFVLVFNRMKLEGKPRNKFYQRQHNTQRLQTNIHKPHPVGKQFILNCQDFKI